MSKTNNNIIRRNMSVFNIIFTIVVVVINILFSYVFFNMNKYSGLSRPIFVGVNIIMLIILLLLNLIFILTIKTKKTSFFNTLVAMSVILFGIGAYGTYAMAKVNKNIDKIVDTGNVEEKVETSLVVYSDSGEYPVTEEKDLEGKTVGIVTGSNNAELAKKQLETNGVSVSYAEFTDNNELLLALFNGEINAAALPSNYVGIFEVNDGYDVLLKDTKTVSTFESVVQVTTETKSDKDITKEPFTVLVLGVDEGRSDAVILVTVNPISMKATMTSIARDSYVPIACYGGSKSDKLGHARVQSRQCTIDTVSKLVGVPIDYYFESNFKGIVEMVDALGGIVVNNPYEFVGQTSSSQRGHMTVWVPAGENVPLNGEQALAFARERHLYASGDFQRQANQQQVIKAILTKAMRTADLNKLLNVLDAAGENVSTNLSVDQLIDLFNFVMKKAGRYYDDAHPENTILLQGSRITGYNSGIWNEAAQLSLSIVRLFEGSIKDTNEALTRNTEMDTKITAPTSWRWDANWVFSAPSISNESYSEQRIVDEMPDIVINFTGKSLAEVQAWASSRGIAIHSVNMDCAATKACGGFGDGIVVEQSVRSGIKSSNVTEITVTLSSNTGGAAAPTGGVYPVTVRYVFQENNAEAAKTVTVNSNQDGTYSITSPKIDGYKASPEVVSGVATGNVDITVFYSKVATATATPGAGQFNIIIRYVVSDGGVAAPPNYKGKTNADGTYSIPSPAVAGYSPDVAVVQGNANVDVDVTVTYKKNATATPTPVPSTTPTPTVVPEPTPEPTPTVVPEPTVEPQPTESTTP